MDKRIVRTRSAIRRYVLSQLKEKDISDFSVSEICEACDLSRSTFYLHYKSVEDVVHEISDGVIDTIVAVVETALPSEALSKVGAYLRKNADEIGVLLQADEGYLIGRIFINREHRYFAEGKQQTSMRAARFGEAEIDRDALVAILEAAIDFSLDFDLLMPPYEENKRVTVDQFNTKMDNSKFTTGKRLGYEFDISDI